MREVGLNELSWRIYSDSWRLVAHGGALVSKIHEHTNHGDPFVRTFMNKILEEVLDSC